MVKLEGLFLIVLIMYEHLYNCIHVVTRHRSRAVSAVAIVTLMEDSRSADSIRKITGSNPGLGTPLSKKLTI